MKITIDIPSCTTELLEKENVPKEKWEEIIIDFLDETFDEYYYVGPTEFELWLIERGSIENYL